MPARAHDDLRRCDDARGEALGRGLRRLLRLRSGRQARDEVESEPREAQAARGREKHGDAHDHDRERAGAVRREVAEAGAERPPAGRRAGGLAGLCGRRDARLSRRRQAARPEHQPAEHREQRRDQRDGHDEADDHAEREARPEVAEERLPGHQQRGRAGRDHQPGRQDDRRVLRRSRARGCDPALAGYEARAEARHIEDRVVGHDAEQQDDDQRVELGRRREAVTIPGPAHDVRRDEVGDAADEQREQRRDQRPEGDCDDERDHGHRDRLDQRQASGDLVLLREARRHRPGDAGDRGPAKIASRIGLRGPDLVRPAHGRVEEEIGDGGGAVLVGRRDEPRIVHQRERAQQAGRARRGAAVDARGGRDRGPLGRGGEAGGVPLHDRDAAQHRYGEELCRLPLGGDRRGGGGRQVGEAAVLASEARQVQCGQRRRGDPGGDDEQAQRPRRHKGVGAGGAALCGRLGFRVRLVAGVARHRGVLPRRVAARRPRVDGRGTRARPRAASQSLVPRQLVALSPLAVPVVPP